MFLKVTIDQYKMGGIWKMNSEDGVEATLNSDSITRYFVDASGLVNVTLKNSTITKLRIKESKSKIDKLLGAK